MGKSKGSNKSQNSTGLHAMMSQWERGKEEGKEQFVVFVGDYWEWHSISIECLRNRDKAFLFIYLLIFSDGTNKKFPQDLDISADVTISMKMNILFSFFFF